LGNYTGGPYSSGTKKGSELPKELILRQILEEQLDLDEEFLGPKEHG
jgi:hypothetical protein